MAGAIHGNPDSTLVFAPFEPGKPANGGNWATVHSQAIRQEQRSLSGVPGLDSEATGRDAAKLGALDRLPNFAPFLAKDAMERAGIHCDAGFFAISDDEVDAVSGRLKGKLRSLAAKALGVAANDQAGPEFVLQIDRLWALEGVNDVQPLSRALQIADEDALAAFQAWIGISYFETEYQLREWQLLTLVQWLIDNETKNLPAMFAERNEYLIKLVSVRSKLKTIWRSYKDVLARFKDAIAFIEHSGADIGPLAGYMANVRRDYWRASTLILLIDQCQSIYVAHQQPDGFVPETFDTMNAIISLQNDILSDYQAA
jgi:hypothetical protein